MEDRDFFDHLYQLWAKTSCANDRYWDYHYHGGKNVCYINAVSQDGEKQRVASYVGEPDADFITAVHGCLPDLVRRLHAALDEADQADYDRDSRECRIAELELEVSQLKDQLAETKVSKTWC